MDPSIQSIVGSPKTFGKKTFQRKDMGKPQTKAAIVKIAIEISKVATICRKAFIKLTPPL
jgi:hypothetical protein